MTVAELAEKLGGTVEGDGTAKLLRLAGLTEAKNGDLSFLANRRYAPQMAQTEASAVIVNRDWTGVSSAGALIRVKNADEAFAEAALLIAPPAPARHPGIDARAYVSPGALIGHNVHIGPFTVIETGAKIGDDCVIEAQCFIGEDVTLGEGSHLYPQVSIRERVQIGKRFLAHSGAVVGSDGFGFTVGRHPDGTPKIGKILQIGVVVIGDDVELGANAVIDRARFGETHIGNCVKIDNLVEIAHNVRIGDYSGIIAQAGIAGSATVGSGVKIWAQAGISGHLHIADGAQIGPQCGVTRDVAPGAYVIGTPEMSLKNIAGISKAPEQIAKLRRRLMELEAEVTKLGGVLK